MAAPNLTTNPTNLGADTHDAPSVLVAMGYLEDGWHSSCRVAEGLTSALVARDSQFARGVALYAPEAHHPPQWLDRRWRYGRDVPGGGILHLLDQSYGDAILRMQGRFAATVVYVADLAFWHERTLLNGWIRRRILRGLGQATALVATSQQTAAELKAAAGLTVARVVHPGIELDAFPEDLGARRPGQLLHVGSMLPRKGIDRLLRFLACLPAPYELLQIGGEFSASHRGLIASLGLQKRVRQHPFAPGGELAAAYRQAEALVFPSRYEGFGLPALEARVSGTRIALSSSVPSAERLVGDGGTIILDFQAFDEGGSTRDREVEIRRFLGWTAPAAVPLARRDQLGWDRAAAEFEAVYQSLTV